MIKNIIESIQRENFIRYNISPDAIAEVYAAKQTLAFEKRRIGLDLLSSEYNLEEKSKYELYDTFLVFKNLEDEIRDSALFLGYSIPNEKIEIFSLISGEVNAYAGYIEKHELRVIVFNHAIYHFLESMIRSCVLLFSWENQEDGNLKYRLSQKLAAEKLSSDQKLIEYINNSASAFICADIEAFYQLEPIPIPEHMVSTFGALRHAVWLFLMGHEYAHIFHGDVGSVSYIDVMSFDKNQQPVKKKMEGWNIEYACDCRGWELMNYKMQNKYGCGIEFNLMAGAIFFSAIDFLYRSIEEITGVKNFSHSETHPPPINRWQFLAKSIHQSTSGNVDANSFKFGSEIADIIEVLYAYTDDARGKLSSKKEGVISHIWGVNST